MSTAALVSRCIAVEAAGALYALPVEQVREVVSRRTEARVFHAPRAVVGVMNLRGDVLPVLDLGLLLGAEQPVLGTEARVVVVLDAQGRRAGLLVDRLVGLRESPPEGLSAPPATLPEAQRRAALGALAASPPCLVLDVGLLFDDPSLAPLAGRP